MKSGTNIVPWEWVYADSSLAASEPSSFRPPASEKSARSANEGEANDNDNANANRDDEEDDISIMSMTDDEEEEARTPVRCAEFVMLGHACHACPQRLSC